MKLHHAILCLAFLLANCGGIKVGVDEETLDTLETLFEDSDGDGDTEDEVIGGEDPGEGEEELFEPYGQKDLSLYSLLGTYTRNDIPFDACTNPYFHNKHFPATLRGYAALGFVAIAFEDIDQRMWIDSPVYEDGTFDAFFASPSDYLACVCGYYISASGAESLQCTCEERIGLDVCTLRYDRI